MKYAVAAAIYLSLVFAWWFADFFLTGRRTTWRESFPAYFMGGSMMLLAIWTVTE